MCVGGGGGVQPSKHKTCIAFVQCWSNVEDVGPTLYTCYRNVLCLLESRSQQSRFIDPMLC